MEQVVYINGELVSRDKARISAFDRGLLYGYGLFETMRSYNGRVFRLDRHIARLADSAAFLGIKEALEPEKLESGVLMTLKANGLEDARIRLTVTAGEGSRGIALPSTGNITTIITVEALALPSAEKYSKGLRTSIAAIRRNNKSPLCRMKTLGYMENMLAHTEAVNAGCDEAILLNTDGYVAECSASNIFIVEEGRLFTPPIEDGALPGITRGIVIELAAKQGIDLMQESIGVERLKGAQEVFITNSVIEIMPVASIDGREAGSGGRGKVTERLTEEYRKLTSSLAR
ncbi:MAG: aminotransferase class IV [Dehalococcoidia bacterium]|jgi:branched-chain amino acid aminotransferase